MLTRRGLAKLQAAGDAVFIVASYAAIPCRFELQCNSTTQASVLSFMNPEKCSTPQSLRRFTLELLSADSVPTVMISGMGSDRMPISAQPVPHITDMKQSQIRLFY